jgi:tetratricopeptide (TPR) repeat protein
MTGNRAAFETAIKKAQNNAWEKRWMKAIEQYELAIAEFPEDVTARSGLAFAYYRGERLREALREYRKLSELRPIDPMPRTKMAQVLESLGRTSDAAEAWMGVAELYVQLEDLKRAMEVCREAIRLQPTNKEARGRLAEAYALEANTADAAREHLALARLWNEEGEPERAAVCCQDALSLDPGNKGARVLLERLASEDVVIASAPSLVVGKEDLGPVDEVLKMTLASLAEDLLGDGFLVESAENASSEELESESEVSAILGKAIDLHSRGRIEDALVYYEEALESGVRRPEIVFSLGLLNKELSHFEEAVRHLQRSAEVPEYSVASHLTLGQCFWAQGRANEALDHFLAAFRIIDLESAEANRIEDVNRAYRDLAASGWGQGDGQGSELLVHSLMELLSASDWKQKVKEARDKLDSLAENGVVPILPEVLGIPGGEEVLDRMVRSRRYLKGGMPFTALEECYSAIRRAPTYLPLHLVLAEVFARQGKAEEAVGKYAAVAEAYVMRGDPSKAVGVYRRALAAAPMTIGVRERLIDLLVEQGEPKLALDEYLALGESHYRLARLDTALEIYERALGVADQAEVSTDRLVDILHRVADLHMQRVHWREATTTYEQIVALSPEDEQARIHLVELRYKLGQDKAALKDVDALIVRQGSRNEFERVIAMLKDLMALNPQDIALRSRLSGIYLELGMKREAVAELDTLGELQLETGRKKDAVQTLQTIISLEPEEKGGYVQLLKEIQESTDTA